MNKRNGFLLAMALGFGVTAAWIDSAIAGDVTSDESFISTMESGSGEVKAGDSARDDENAQDQCRGIYDYYRCVAIPGCVWVGGEGQYCRRC